MESNSLSYIGAFLGGLLVSFTPCVYPMIPIVVGYIGARSSKSVGHGFRLSLSYCLGLSLVYAALGVFAALSGKIFGMLSANPFVNIGVGSLFIIFGLIILDVFSIPHINLLGTKKFKVEPSGFGAFILGATSGFVAGPCTAPALGSILVYVSSKQNVVFGATLMFTFTMGMSVVLLFIGTFSSLINFLPKSEKWMNVMKKILGLLLIGIGCYFIFVAGRRWV